MTKREFLEEVKCSDLCPKDFERMLDLQEKYQNLALETLKEFHRVCVKNNIEYQLAFGSLLGAVRDNGIIPWDYDVDVFVHAEDRIFLLSCLEKDLDESFYYDSLENNPKRQGVIIRLAPKNYNTLHLHIDVFFLAGTPDDEKLSKKHCLKLRRASAVVSVKNTPLFEINPFVSPRGWLEVAVGKVLFLFKTKEKAFKTYLELCTKYDSRNSSKLINANSYGGTYYMTASFFSPVILYKTDFGDFYITSRYDELLKELFGDYMKVPSLKFRINDVKEHYRVFKGTEQFAVKNTEENNA